MSRIRDFLSDFDDYELAYFAKFKLPAYMKATQTKIGEYLAERGITESKVEWLISENAKRDLTDEKERCPRCRSAKIRKDRVEWTDTSGRAGYVDEVAALDGLSGRATYASREICNVCGFWLKDPNREQKRSFVQKVIDFFAAVSGGI